MTNSQEIFTDDPASGNVKEGQTLRCVSLVDLTPSADAEVNKTNEKSEAEEDDTPTAGEMIPPDGGWGWMVALGSFIITTLLPMLGPCFGVLFSRYLLQEGTSSTVTAWIFSLFCFIWNFMGLITRPLTKEFGWRTVAITGSAIASFSLIASAFTPSPEFLFFSFSLLSGAGGGTVVCICFTTVPLYFDKKRGIANAIMMAGVCAGQVVGPPLARLLQDEFGFSGATLILGGLLLHSCVGASLFHPVEWHSTAARPRGPSIEASLPLVSRGKRRAAGDRREKSISRSLCDEPGTTAAGTASPKDLCRRLRSSSCTLRNNSSLALSTLDVASNAALPDAEAADQLHDGGGEGAPPRNSFCRILLRVGRSVVSDLAILRSPRACIIAFGGTFCINGYLNFMMMVPFAMQAAGHSLQASAWCISVSAICNLLTRLLVSSLSDWPRFNIRACYMSGFAIVSFTIFIFPFLTELTHLLATMASFGCGVGITMGLYNLVMIDVMGIGNLAPVFGACCFMVAIGFICLGPLIGFIRDASSSYTLSMWVVASMLLAGFGLWLFMPAAVRYDERRAKEKKEQEQKP